MSRGWVDGKDRWKDRSKAEGGWICRTDGKAARRRVVGWKRGVDRNSLEITTPQGAELRLYPRPAYPSAYENPKSANDVLLILALSQIPAI